MSFFDLLWLMSYIFSYRKHSPVTSSLRTPVLVSTEWLHNFLQNHTNSTKHVRVLETSFNPDPTSNYTTTYAQGHIPQAVYFDLYKCVNGTIEIPKEIPDLECITDYIRGLGVWPDTHVIVYTRSAVTQSFRAWWTFRLFGHTKVSVLDGNFQKWLDDGFQTSTNVPVVERSTFMGELNSSMLRSYDDMVENLETKREEVVDSRRPDSIWVSGRSYDSGMIPGAKMVTYTTVFNTDGTMKNKQELKEIFKKSGVDLSLLLVTYCNTGMKSTVVAAAAHILGLRVSMYYGSWNEWRRRAPEYLKHRVWEKGLP